MARPHIEPFCDRDTGFKNMILPGFAGGMRYKMLSLDVDSGACSMTVQYDGGYRRAPGFSWSEMEMIVIEGELQVGDRTCRKGHYFFVPAGYALPEISTAQGCLVLVMYNTGEPSHEESTEHHPLAQVDLYHSVDSYMDLPWAMGNVTKPSVAAGCLIKLLNYNPISHAMTFLYCMTPGYYQDNISYHDCAEESYHLWGTSWMMQFGEVPTGGYFWRPAYINHGCFKSDLGILAIGRTDGDLHNYFHHDPYSTPEENHERAAAAVARHKPALYKWILTHEHNHLPHDFEHPDDTYQATDYDSGIHMHDDGTSHSHAHGGAHSHLGGKKKNR